MKKNNIIKYWSPSLTVDVAIFTIEDDKLKILLVDRLHEPFKGQPALPGGFMHEHETTFETAKRIMRDKIGLENFYVEQLYTFDDLDRDPRGQILSVSYYALAARSKIKLVKHDNQPSPIFLPVTKLPRLPFDHNKIINYAVKRLQAKLEYTSVVYSLLPKLFTLSDLQKTYETVFNRKLDKRNFRKKFLSLKLIRATKKKITGQRMRPALLYEFIDKAVTEIDRFI